MNAELIAFASDIGVFVLAAAIAVYALFADDGEPPTGEF